MSMVQAAMLCAAKPSICLPKLDVASQNAELRFRIGP